MNKARYEKPQMHFVALRNQEAVAKPCWNKGDTSTVYYYNSPGTGYVSFTVTSGSCNLDGLNIEYINVPTAQQPSAREALIAAISQAGGNAGQNWAQDKTPIKDDPDPSWS